MYPNVLNLAQDVLSKFRRMESKLGDGLRPYKFKAVINFPEYLIPVFLSAFSGMDLLLKNIDIPSVSVQTTTVTIMGREVTIPLYQEINNEIPLTFYVDNALIIRDAFEFWIRSYDKSLCQKEEVPSDRFGNWSIKGIVNMLKKNPTDLILTPGDSKNLDYTGSIEVFPLDYLNLRIEKFIINNAYPIRVEAIKMDSSDVSSIAQVTVSFKYSHITRKKITLKDSIVDMGMDAISGVY